MNTSTAVMLINEEIRAITTSYDVEPENKTGFVPKRVMFKTLDKTINVGDLVVVPTSTRHGFTVVKVMEVDVDVDFESPTKIEWIVQKVDTAPYSTILQEENKWVETLKASEKRRKREEIKKNMLDLYNDEGIKSLDFNSVKALTESSNQPF